ncbi:MAG: Rrf2 family transcriptional regulator, partial [Alphaproteobacteria bacterium]|nr:Rrf2 family transcriptional regulator [Alphaproteobacteria bacterium]
MRLQKSTEFALYAVLELAADPDRQLSTAGIAARYGISAHHLAKVMRQLVRAGLIQSV